MAHKHPTLIDRRTWDLSIYKAAAELKSEARRTYIGILWWIFEPVIFMLIFYFVFGVIFGRGTADFISFLLVGLTVWHWFQATIIQCSTSIRGNFGIIQQANVPKVIFPTSIMLANGIKFLAVIAVLLAYLSTLGPGISISWFAVFPILLCFQLLIAGMAYTLSAVLPFFPDIQVIVDNLFRALFFLSGIFYDIGDIDDRFASWLNLNPVAVLLENLRTVLLRHSAPNWSQLLTVTVISIVMIGIGIALIKHNEKKYPKIAI